MNDPVFAMNKIEQIIMESSDWDYPLQLGAFATIMHLIRELQGYLKEQKPPGWGNADYKLAKLQGYVGAFFGLDFAGEPAPTKHLTGALGTIGILHDFFKNAD